MKLLKFNLIFIPFLALCLGVVQESARAKTENGNSLAIFFENGVSGQLRKALPVPALLR